MYSLKVKNDRGESLALSNDKRYTVYKIEGLTPPKANLSISANSTTDGNKINSARLESRNIVIYLKLEGDIEESRINLYKYFPVKKGIQLFFKNTSREVFIEGTVELIECDLFAQSQVAQISIICGKPYFKAVDYLVTAFGDVSNLFEFPFSIAKNGIEFSVISTNQRRSIINSGDTETGVIIELFAVGSVVKPVLYNVLTGGKMKLNTTMLPSDKIVINTNVGEKSIILVRDGVSYNAMGYMSPDSEWFVLKSGDNVFTYDAESGTTNLQITFTTNLLYSGV